MSVSRDVDLTLKLDFKDEQPTKYVKFQEDKNNYKRYHKVKRTSQISQTTGIDPINNFNPSFRSTTSSTTLSSEWFDRILYSNVEYVEEKVCWRPLKNDPDIYDCSRYEDEKWFYNEANRNFTMGSKEDRLLMHYRLMKEQEHYPDNQCECCGRRFNLNNCFSHKYHLCSNCYYALENRIDTLRLT